MPSVKLYDLAPSPNSMKVRIALNYKEIPFEKIPVNPQDRSDIVKISGQPLTPVLVHDERVVFDSSAILRYVEANFRSTRPLFSADSQTMHEIEDFELFGRKELGSPIGTAFGQFFSPEKDVAKIAQASRQLNHAAARIEERLAAGQWLVGDKMTAADVSLAPLVFQGMLPPKAAEANDIARFFAKHLELGGGRERTRAWALKVTAYDR